MSEQFTIDQLAAAVANHMKSVIPLEVDLWSTVEIAAYLKKSPASVADRVVCLPGFPQAIRLPSATGGKGHPLWKAIEVIAWTEKHQERRAA